MNPTKSDSTVQRKPSFVSKNIENVLNDSVLWKTISKKNNGCFRQLIWICPQENYSSIVFREGNYLKIRALLTKRLGESRDGLASGQTVFDPDYFVWLLIECVFLVDLETKNEETILRNKHVVDKE